MIPNNVSKSKFRKSSTVDNTFHRNVKTKISVLWRRQVSGQESWAGPCRPTWSLMTMEQAVFARKTRLRQTTCLLHSSCMEGNTYTNNLVLTRTTNTLSSLTRTYFSQWEEPSSPSVKRVQTRRPWACKSVWKGFLCMSSRLGVGSLSMTCVGL